MQQKTKFSTISTVVELPEYLAGKLSDYLELKQNSGLSQDDAIALALKILLEAAGLATTQYTTEEKARGILKLCPGIDPQRFAVKLFGGEALMKRSKGEGKRISITASREIEKLKESKVIEIICGDMYPNGAVYLFGQAPQGRKLFNGIQGDIKTYTTEDLPRSQRQEHKPIIRRSINEDRANQLESQALSEAKGPRIKLVEKKIAEKLQPESTAKRYRSTRHDCDRRFALILRLIDQAEQEAIAYGVPMRSRQEIARRSGYSIRWVKKNSDNQRQMEACETYDAALKRVEESHSNIVVSPPENSLQAFLDQLKKEKDLAIKGGWDLPKKEGIACRAGINRHWIWNDHAGPREAREAYEKAIAEVSESKVGALSANQNSQQIRA